MEALYFPRLSLPGMAWTYPNLLFFDRIRTIAPNGVNLETLFDGPTRSLIAEGMVEPLDPTPYIRDDQGDTQALSYFLGAASSQRRRNKKQRMARIHIGKLTYMALTQELIRAGLLRECLHGPNEDRDWLEGQHWVIQHLMSLIAARVLANHQQMPLITDENEAKINLVGSRHSSLTSAKRRLLAVQRLLPIGPDVNIADIVSFRRRNATSLAEFRQLVTELSLRSAEGERGEVDFERRLQAVEQHRRELVRSIQEIQSGRPAITIAISAASIIAPVLEQSPYSVAAGFAGFAYVLWNESANHRRQRQIMRDRLVYAALAQHEFAPRDVDELLR
ncbi:hypothetical protein [Georhizobium sp. MAB10]|uniref:hypothetical protein n=1 Tax=Georhizobium sp. MAB10 TaxID=3028319 RepID=UPI003855B54C